MEQEVRIRRCYGTGRFKTRPDRPRRGAASGRDRRPVQDLIGELLPESRWGRCRWRALFAGAIGTFALVFAGGERVMVGARTARSDTSVSRSRSGS